MKYNHQLLSYICKNAIRRDKMKTDYITKTFELHYDRMNYAKVIGAHSHDYWELDYIKKGYGLHIFNGLSEPCQEGELILVPSDVTHNWIIDSASASDAGRVETYSLFFNPKLAKSRFESVPELQTVWQSLATINQPIEIVGESAEVLKNMILIMSQESELHQVPHFLQILITLAECTNQRNIQIGNSKPSNPDVQNTMKRVYQFILDNYTRRITLDEVAAVACMNKSAFCTFFKRHYSQSFFYVLNEHRINVACLMLSEEPVKDIAEISIAVGFNDVPYFHRVFKRYKGFAPNEYRQKILKYKRQRG